MVFFFFFNDTATTEIYTLSLHDALPISRLFPRLCIQRANDRLEFDRPTHHRPAQQQELDRQSHVAAGAQLRSEEHTSELQSPCNLVCRLLLEKKKTSSSGLSHHRSNYDV